MGPIITVPIIPDRTKDGFGLLLFRMVEGEVSVIGDAGLTDYDIDRAVNYQGSKLLEKLDDQLGMVQALIDGEVYARMRRIWRTNENGERVLMERPKRTRPWYWMSGAGGCYFQV